MEVNLHMCQRTSVPFIYTDLLNSGGSKGGAIRSGHGIHCDQLILRKISKNGANR